jgi:hypothetical protein
VVIVMFVIYRYKDPTIRQSSAEIQPVLVLPVEDNFAVHIMYN